MTKNFQKGAYISSSMASSGIISSDTTLEKPGLHFPEELLTPCFLPKQRERRKLLILNW